jgi:hypothetical protein
LTGRLAATSTLNFMTASPQRLALDLQKALQDLKQEKQRTQQLLQEMDRQNHELDRLRSSVHRESNSRLLAEEALDETRDRLQLAVDAARLALWAASVAPGFSHGPMGGDAGRCGRRRLLGSC